MLPGAGPGSSHIPYLLFTPPFWSRSSPTFPSRFPLFVTDFMFGPSIYVHALRVCLATEGVQQSHSASAASLITSSVPNLLPAHARPSPNCPLSVAVPRDWEKLHSIGVKIKAHHRQRRLRPGPQAASLSSTLLLCRWWVASMISPRTTSLGRATAVAAAAT